MRIITQFIALSTRGNTDIHDITAEVQTLVDRLDLAEGNVTLFVPGSTGGLTTIEYEPGLLKDLPEAFERLRLPRDATLTTTPGGMATGIPT